MGSGGQPASISISHQGLIRSSQLVILGQAALCAWLGALQVAGSALCHNPPEEGCRGCVYMWRQLQEKLGPKASVCLKAPAFESLRLQLHLLTEQEKGECLQCDSVRSV